MFFGYFAMHFLILIDKHIPVFVYGTTIDEIKKRVNIRSRS